MRERWPREASMRLKRCERFSQIENLQVNHRLRNVDMINRPNDMAFNDCLLRGLR